MPRRLVLGCGSIGHAVVLRLAARRGTLSVVDPDAERVETLRNEGVAAERGDPTDPATHEGEEPATVVFVGGDDPEQNRAVVRTARRVHPDAVIVAYAGTGTTAADRAALEDAADRVVDPGGSLVDTLTTTIEDEGGERHHRLLRTLRAIPGRLGVFTHDNPDPDAIASALALRDLARSVGTEADACYFGDISHQENRALVNVLELDLKNRDATAFDPAAYAGYALVDHSRPGVNDQLPEDLPVDVVIDHHPPRGAVGGTFVDLRDDAGSTSTLLAGYYDTLGSALDARIATALLYGIRVDTRDFGREITRADFDAAASLIERADTDALARIESPSVTAEMLSVLARAIANREVRGSVLATSAGWTTDRDALAQAADTLLDMEAVTTVLVLGLMEGDELVVASARTRGGAVDIGETLRLAYDQIGSAGGHTDMAGAQIPLGILGSIEDESGSLEEIIGDVLIDRFFEVMADEGTLPTGAEPPSTPTGSAPTSLFEQNDFSPPDPNA